MVRMGSNLVGLARDSFTAEPGSVDRAHTLISRDYAVP
jgi:hypothetical protein